MGEAIRSSILIVDDVNLNIMALTHILSPDYTVNAVNSGKNAIIAAERYQPDLILLDILMPEMDGYDVIAELKRTEKTRNIPVIFITGLSDPGDEEKGLSLGAVDYISKPFSPSIVKLRVHSQIQIINQMRLIIEKETFEKSNRTKSEFLSRMSHEMRTPMNAIMGMTALVKNTSEINKQNDMLDKISEASRHLLRLIDNVLDMSDIEGNTFHITCSAFNFAAALRSVIGKVRPDIEAKQQSLTADIDPAIPGTLSGDEERLSQIMLNLLSNAVKFTPEHGSILIKAILLKADDDTVTIQTAVIDSGIGMSREHREKLFTPFEQADGGIDRKFGGAGLGLAISKNIVRLMGGEISVESEPGKGSKFEFTIKAQRVNVI